MWWCIWWKANRLPTTIYMNEYGYQQESLCDIGCHTLWSHDWSVCLQGYSCYYTNQSLQHGFFYWSWHLVKLSLGLFWHIPFCKILQIRCRIIFSWNLCNFPACLDATNKWEHIERVLKCSQLQVPFPFSVKKVDPFQTL